ncbi:MAG TPA: CBS domain-containing protein [Anaerolineales bacterium]|nr:CBS domain-containing protein [Anaerolineales bacterium]
MAPTKSQTEQEKYGRHRPVTDRDAHEINRIEELSYDLKVHEVMIANVITTTSDVPISSALELLRINRISGLPVVDNGILAGVISLEDIVRAMQKNELGKSVSEYMSTQIMTVNSYDSVVEAIKTFSEKRLGRLPVIDQSKKLVGIITKGDITRGILLAVERDYKEEEVRRYRASHLFEDIISDRTTLVLRYNIKVGDFTHGGNASSHIKRALLRLGADQQLARRCGIAAYEAEMNLIIHTTHGGILKLEVEPHRINIITTDDGPGIPDIQMAQQPGYSTASDKVREMGFGAGMGLVNIKRCVDSIELESTVGKGTKLTMRIAVSSETLNSKRD